MQKKDKVALTLMKMKLNISYRALAAIFGISPWTASRWFQETLRFLAQASKKGVTWLPKDIIQKRMPPSFRALFPTCRCIVDCSEIYIEKPAKQKQNVLCFSNYKSHLTGKFFVAVAPSG